MSRWQPVPGNHRPAIVQHLDVPLANVDHRLDSQSHSRLQDRRTPTAIIKVRYLRVLVDFFAHAMPNKFPDDAVSVGLDTALDSP